MAEEQQARGLKSARPKGSPRRYERAGSCRGRQRSECAHMHRCKTGRAPKSSCQRQRSNKESSCQRQRSNVGQRPQICEATNGSPHDERRLVPSRAEERSGERKLVPTAEERSNKSSCQGQRSNIGQKPQICEAKGLSITNEKKASKGSCQRQRSE